jgi:hypothetical protein
VGVAASLLYLAFAVPAWAQQPTPVPTPKTITAPSAPPVAAPDEVAPGLESVPLSPYLTPLGSYVNPPVMPVPLPGGSHSCPAEPLCVLGGPSY